jgi:uncharacterized membrane protein
MGGVDARVVDAGRGLGWWSDAWALFMKNAGMWIVLAIATMLILGVISLVPLLGSLVASVLFPAFMASWMLAARKLQSGGTLEIGDLFLGFKDKLNPLLVLGAVFLVFMVVITLVVGGLGAGAVFGMAMGGARSSNTGVLAAVGVGMLALLVALVLGMLLSMAAWFAPALIVFRNMAPVDAMKASFSASLKNFMSMLVFAVIYFVASIVASIPFGLGWVLLVPLTLLTVYVSYQDIFEQ